MRTTRPAIDTACIPWEAITPEISCKPLNGDRKTGPHTMILRSTPRQPSAPGGQYHDHDEEFFCLGGDFTFDGASWFSAGSYAFYPAYFVHGTRVNVRGGYELYLRNGGAGPAHLLDQAQSDVPYAIDHRASADRATSHVDAFSCAASPVEQLPGWTLAKLREDRAADDASVLLTGNTQAAGRTALLEANKMLELLVLSGTFRTGAGNLLGAGHYLAECAPRARCEIVCVEPGRILASHAGGFAIGR